MADGYSRHRNGILSGDDLQEKKLKYLVRDHVSNYTSCFLLKRPAPFGQLQSNFYSLFKKKLDMVFYLYYVT
jgi:hypothetical protein